jgi:predicted CXXCH cytochrome family protein
LAVKVRNDFYKTVANEHLIKTGAAAEQPKTRAWLASLGKKTWTWRRWGVAVLVAASLAVAVISCGTFTGTVVEPPQIAGATFVGSQNCEQCHQEIYRKFKTSDHARLQAKGKNAENIGCESCHGPGSLHTQSGGLARTIINPRRDPETCFQCHLEKRGNFSLPYHHPLEEGRVSCADCHNPHEGRAINGGYTAHASINDACFKCHTEQRGPHIFEHEAMREGCTTCHNPHGSVNQKMLVSRNAELCLKCHYQQQTTAGQIMIGNFVHQGAGRDFLQRGTCWSAGCHEAVHGSQVNSHLRF